MKVKKTTRPVSLLVLIAAVSVVSFSFTFTVSKQGLFNGNIDRFRSECQRAMLVESQPQVHLRVAKQMKSSSGLSGAEWEFRIASSGEHGMYALIDSVSPLLSDGRSFALLEVGGEERRLRTQASNAEAVSFSHDFSYGLFPDEWIGRKRRLEFMYPVMGRSRITQVDGRKSFLDSRTHHGGKMHAVDIKAELGSPVRNGRAGIVVHAFDGYADAGCSLPELSDKSNIVVIQHEDGSESVYGHLMQGSITVKEGASVKAGELIARVGNSGKSSAPHLHLQVGGLTEVGYKTIPLVFHGCPGDSFVPAIGRVEC